MKKITVILADDHPALRQGIKTMLEMEGDLKVIDEASDGQEALAKVRELKPDVLVLDVSMPNMSGLDVIRTLAQEETPTRVLALSAYDDENFIIEMVEAGAAGYLLKREALETIVEAVRGVAAGETGWFSDAIIEKMARRPLQERSVEQQLTNREREILHFLALGWTNNQIGSEMGISERTVRYHLRNIYDKIGANSRGAAIAWAIRHGFGKKQEM